MVNPWSFYFALQILRPTDTLQSKQKSRGTTTGTKPQCRVWPVEAKWQKNSEAVHIVVRKQHQKNDWGQTCLFFFF